MADSFFGFVTELPEFETIDGINDVPKEDEDNIDLLNDETFGNASIGKVAQAANDCDLLDSSWEDKRTDLSKYIDQHQPNRTENTKDVVSLDEAFFPKDPETEVEEEIIGNSILQLGLDDDQDDIEYKGKQKNVNYNPQKDTWMSPPREDSDSLSSLQEMLSPGKGIWTSPQQSIDDNSSAPVQTPASSDKGDIIKTLFKSGNTRKKQLSLESIPPPPIPNRPPVVRAMTLEEVEKMLVTEKNAKNTEIPQATIIERRNPVTPGPPPGFMLPLDTPPSGLPWRTPHGLISAQDRARLAHMSPMMPGRMPAPSLLPDMSPLLPLGFSVPRRFEGMRNQGPFGGRTPMSSGRYRRPFWRHPTPRSAHHNQGSWQDRYQRDPQESWLSMSPSVLMTAKEKEWVVKIQLMQLVNNDPYLTDYYYVTSMERKLLESTMVSNANSDGKEEEDLEKTKRILDKTNQYRDDRDYKPATFEGSLGKLSLSSVHHPRQLVDVSHVAAEAEGKSRQGQGEASKRRFLIFGLIEKAFDILLTLQDIERRKSEVPEEERNVFREERARRIEKLFNMFRLKLCSDGETSDEDFEVFLLILNISKGKKLAARLLDVFNLEQAESLVLAIWKGTPMLARKDLNQEMYSVLLKPVCRVIESTSKDVLAQAIDTMKTKPVQFLTSKFGIMFCSSCVQRLTALDAIDASGKKLISSLGNQVLKALPSLSEKSRQRNKTELRMLMTMFNEES